MYDRETVRALVSAFNVHNYARNTVKTNFTLQSDGKKDYIVVSFDKSMDTYQCREYLDSIKRKIIREFYGIEESNDAEILDTAKLIFDVNSFPFDISDRDWSWDKQHGFKFVTPVDKGVIFNLKSHLASSLKKDILEDMRVSSATIAFKEKKYLWHDEFDNKELRKQFERKFLSRMKERYENVPKNPLEVKGNSVYIKDVFDDARFIDSVTRYKAWLTGMDLGVGNDVDHSVKSFKNMIIRSTYSMTEVMIDGFILSPPLNGRVVSILTPITQNGKGIKLLTKEEVRAINRAFNNAILDDISDKTQATLKVNGSNVVYGIDFSNKEISHCVITKIIEDSVINAKHELSIDPELPRTLLTEPSLTRGLPTYGQDGVLNESPRRGSKRKEETVGLFLVLPGEIGQTSSFGNVLAAQPQGRWSFSPPPPPPFIPIRSSSTSTRGPGSSPPPLIPSSGSVSGSQLPVSFTSTRGPGSLPLPLISISGNVRGFQPPAQQSFSGPSRSSSRGPRLQPYVLQRCPSAYSVGSGCSRSLRPSVGGPSSSKGAQAGANISKKEEKLFEKLLYTLNLMNYTLDGVYTNFFAKDGKIVSYLHNNVDREKYLQAVKDYIIEEYYGTEEEARESCDLDEFPFKFLPDPDYKKNKNDCEKKTVVANISSDALSNLKILFSQKFGKNVDAIDISAVKKVEKREKDEWVDYQLSNKDSLEEACEGYFPDEEAIEEACQDCFPDEGAMKIIPIAFEGDEYVLDRSRDICEVQLLYREQLRRFRSTSLEKRKSSDKPLTEEEKNLFKALLYAFNLSNYIFECSETNFIVKNGEIASLIDDSVNVKEYLQEVIDKTKEEYRVNKKEAYDLNEFPFKFLSNCEKNQKTTVVANISSGALFNLKKLFLYGYEKKVKIGDIDINIVEKAVKSKRGELVNSDVKKIEEERIRKEGGRYERVTPHEIVTASYPDEGALEDIQIMKYETGYYLDRENENWETKSLVEKLGISKAKKMQHKDEEKDSGKGTSGSEVDLMDSEESSPVQQQNSSQNTTRGSPKRKPEEPHEGSPTSKSQRSGSGNSSSEEAGDSPHSNLSDSELCGQFSKTRISRW